MSEIIDFTKLFNWDYLTQTPPLQMRHGLAFIIILAALIFFGAGLQIYNFKKTYPRFYKRFIKRLADFFLYMPFLLIMLILARLGGLSALSIRFYLVLFLAIWLIWFLFLVYYRLVIIPAMWLKYEHRKREESYVKHGNKTR